MDEIGGQISTPETTNPQLQIYQKRTGHDYQIPG